VIHLLVNFWQERDFKLSLEPELKPLARMRASMLPMVAAGKNTPSAWLRFIPEKIRKKIRFHMPCAYFVVFFPPPSHPGVGGCDRSCQLHVRRQADVESDQKELSNTKMCLPVQSWLEFETVIQGQEMVVDRQNHASCCACSHKRAAFILTLPAAGCSSHTLLPADAREWGMYNYGEWARHGDKQVREWGFLECGEMDACK